MNKKLQFVAATLACGILAAVINMTLIGRADFTMTQGAGTTIKAIDLNNQGTSLCAAASTECAATAIINAAGTEIGTSLLAAVQGPIPAQTTSSVTIGQIGGSVNITPTDCSIALATGNTAQFIITTSPVLHGFTISNIDSLAGSGELVWISFTGQASASTLGSYPLIPPSGTTQGGGSYSSPLGFGSNHGVQVVAATTGHKISCTLW